MNKETYFLELNKSNDDKRLVKLEEYAKAHKVPIIQKDGIQFLSQMIKLSQTERILEIGSAIGYSAINFALISSNIKITTIERDEVMYQKAVENVKLFGLEHQIKIIYGDALTVELDQFDEFDLIFIDAAKSQYQKFFEKYTPYLRTGGLVVTDNLIFHNMIFDEHIENKNTRQLVTKIKKYNEWLSQNDAYNTYFCPLGDGLALSIKK